MCNALLTESFARGLTPCYYSSPSRGVNHLANGSVRNESYKEGGVGERGEEEGQVERGVDEEKKGKGREVGGD